MPSCPYRRMSIAARRGLTAFYERVAIAFVSGTAASSNRSQPSKTNGRHQRLHLTLLQQAILADGNAGATTKIRSAPQEFNSVRHEALGQPPSAVCVSPHHARVTPTSAVREHPRSASGNPNGQINWQRDLILASEARRRECSARPQPTRGIVLSRADME
jgi:hypothetical protein